MKSTIAKFCVAVLAVVLVIIVGLTIRHQLNSESAPSPNSLAPKDNTHVEFPVGAPQLGYIRVNNVHTSDMPIAEPINARIVYDENATARITSPITGRIVRLQAEQGDRVRQGDVLLELNSPELASAEADWNKSRADVMLKKLAYERAKNLFDNEVIARKDLEVTVADYSQAQAEEERTQVKLKNLYSGGHNHGRFTLKSPINGVVANRIVNPGEEVRPDLTDPLYVVSDLSRLWVMVDVPERIMAGIHVGQRVSMRTDAYPDITFEATVDKIGVALDPNTRRVPIRCVVGNKEQKLKPEMFARVSFLHEDGRTAIKLPNTSLIVEGIYTYLFVELRAGSFEKRRVHIGLTEDTHSYIDAGLKEHERVVEEGALLLNSEIASNVR
ncbi:MAG: efflux RND transporter periplasmic adaptor subunit [Methylophilaceae bacterium]|nr:efflux RND transporter periplasmic adaptor subunit [Methylophilaceae bacterium]